MSERAEYWPAPAKLNLMLRVVGRRPDGYHLLQTVFQFLDHGDRLRFRLRDDGRILRPGDIDGVAEADDLVVRAARLLQQVAGVSRGVEIGLDKRLPMGAGLGGGSSDAATTLVALNRLWGCGLDRAALARLGLRLGADVPVFVHGFAAWAEGVGERLQPVDLPEPWYLVLVPPCHVSTAVVFADPRLTRDSPRITIRDFLAGSRENDCVSVVRRRFPAVAEAMEWLGRFAEPQLTGTGAGVFACFPDEMSARAVWKKAAERYPAFVARGRNLSPLREREH
ncbi:MAG TPA: 4-(cytidine 5'-diphospho)-2-C-methyl-D-erythritol kinase [Sedimenticola thiotaurini]|uniref:4-diphosphocytidyl-2-C-methyl-D-erythritol kinase n=1 Tax=Sedimenticola thiotaurini TaxID=1543721 RepID=A0A831W3A8_9GAMM|nr:4-(cytidine 5'-diphospho)-2-C-methyl-D-erythritol kinase [Sedimenticola thiotaurini]